jgi:hypothetical protein
MAQHLFVDKRGYQVRFITFRSGKTYQIVARACHLAREHKRGLILQPTKELINKTVQKELLVQPNPPGYGVFHGDTVSGSG